MFGERCTLCGGKLDSRKVCKECGLNNSKSEKNYKVNQSSCDGRPMTHVHEEEQRKKDRQENRGQTTYRKAETVPESYHKAETVPGSYCKAETMPQSYRQKTAAPRQGMPVNKSVQPKKKARWAARFVSAFVILSVLGTIIGSIVEIGGDFFSDSDSGYERPYPYDILDNSGASLPEEGTEEEIELPSGKYIVGVHIPAGYYQADVTDDYDTVQVKDDEHSILMYEYPVQEGGNYLDDLRLFDGALVEISTVGTAVLSTENAQTVNSIDNPLTESYEFEGSVEKKAGVDIEAGVYDLIAEEGLGTVAVHVYEEMEENDEYYEDDEDYEPRYDEERVFMGVESSEGMEYRNLIIPEGAKLIIQDSSGAYAESFKVTLRPSSKIMSTDYLQTYKDFY